MAKYNTQRGMRASAYDAYLKPVLDRENLEILLDTRVHKVRHHPFVVFSINSFIQILFFPADNIQKHYGSQYSRIAR